MFMKKIKLKTQTQTYPQRICVYTLHTRAE